MAKIATKKEIIKNSVFFINEIKKGRIFIYPTDTLYGIGSDALNPKSIKKIIQIKKRKNSAFLIIAPNMEWIYKNCQIINKKCLTLMNSLLPGPYSFILKLKKKKAVDPMANNNSKTIGVRIPKNWFAKIIEKSKTPFISTSVNISGRKPIIQFNKISKKMLAKCDYAVKDDNLSGKASTIIDLTRKEPQVLRDNRPLYAIIDCGSKKTPLIKKILDQLHARSKVIAMEKFSGSDLKDIAGLIISGSPLMVTADKNKKYAKLFGFIKKLRIPVMGICFGHQIIGLVYGSKAVVGKSILGKHRIKIIKKNKLFNGIANQSKFEKKHREHITVPPEFILLADSGLCGNEAMKHKSNPIYGVQFHPEASGKNGQKIFENFINLCEKKYANTK